MKQLASLAGLLLLAACGKEVGHVGFGGEGTHEATMTLKPGEVAFWTDIDAAWEGDAALSYKVELVQGGKTVATTTCDPLGRMSVKTSWVEKNIGSSHSRSGNGKMACEVGLANGGATTVRATLTVGLKPRTLNLKRADLVVKQ